MDTNAVENVLEATELVIEKTPKMIEVGKVVVIAIGTFIAGVATGIGGSKAIKKIGAKKTTKIEKVKEDVKELKSDADKILRKE